MSGAIPPLPYTPPWRGAQLKHRDNFTFYSQKYNIINGRNSTYLQQKVELILSLFLTKHNAIKTQPALN
jgi:hypothetical protein